MSTELSPEVQAVLDAALEWQKWAGDDLKVPEEILENAVDAYRRSIEPPLPVPFEAWLVYTKGALPFMRHYPPLSTDGDDHPTYRCEVIPKERVKP